MEYKKQDITTIQAPALVAHGVNCQNAMGSGVARALYMKWPEVKLHYHKKGSMILGDVQFVEVEPGLVVANCFTQRNYGKDFKRYANPRAIRESLEEAALYALNELAIREIHIPRIGCGLGGLDWEDEVLPELQKIEKQHNVNFVVCDV